MAKRVRLEAIKMPSGVNETGKAVARPSGRLREPVVATYA